MWFPRTECPPGRHPTWSVRRPLDALLPVQLVDRLGDWGRIVCANGWSAWVDGRLLVAVPRDPPGASGPLTRTADPRPLLTRTEDALGRYRRAAEKLAGGGDGESFRRGTHGLRVGVVVEGESLWLYDADHERWVYSDGTRLSTYAATEGPATEGHGDDHEAAEPPRAAAADPGASPPPDEEPTRLVPAAQESTRLVPAAQEPTAGTDGSTAGTDGSTAGMGPGETQVVHEVAAPEPTRVVGEAVGPGETRVVDEVHTPELHTPEPHTPHGGHPAPFLPPERDEPDQPPRPGDA